MALSVLAALYHRDLTGEGQWIDASQTEAGIMLTQVPVLDWGANGRSWERNGNRSPYQEIAPQGIYQCAGDDRWIAITCASQGQWRALAHLAGHDDWAADPRFASAAGRIAHYDELDDGITAWTRSFEPYGLMARLQAAGVAGRRLPDRRRPPRQRPAVAPPGLADRADRHADRPLAAGRDSGPDVPHPALPGRPP